jgi:hypothetical protein
VNVDHPLVILVRDFFKAYGNWIRKPIPRRLSKGDILAFDRQRQRIVYNKLS